MCYPVSILDQEELSPRNQGINPGFCSLSQDVDVIVVGDWSNTRLPIPRPFVWSCTVNHSQLELHFDYKMYSTEEFSDRDNFNSLCTAERQWMQLEDRHMETNLCFCLGQGSVLYPRATSCLIFFPQTRSLLSIVMLMHSHFTTSSQHTSTTLWH